MLKTPILTEHHKESFEHDGYLVIPKAFDNDTVDRIKAWCDELINLPEVSGRQWVYGEESLLEPGKRLISRIENIAPFHSGFAELSNVLKAPAAALLGEDAVLFKEKVNFKLPGGDGFKPHQDSQAGWDTYADFFISVLVCIDKATVENGCLQIAAGHHQRGLFASMKPLTDNDMADMNFVHCPTQPGDLVFFDNYSPHASDANMSNHVRRLYYATYNRASDGDHQAQYYADKHASYPPDVDREQGKEYIFRV